MQWRPVHDPAEVETRGVLETGCHRNNESIIIVRAACFLSKLLCLFVTFLFSV